MIDNNMVSSKAVIAKIIADLDLKEDEIRISDVREYIGEAMEKIGAVQLLEHKVVNLKVENYQAKLPCDLYRLNQVAFSFENGCGWLPMRKVTNSFGVYKKCGECNPKILIKDNALIPLVKNIFNVNTDKEAIDILNEDVNVKLTLSALVNQYTIPSNNGRLIIGNPATFNTSLQYSTKPGYITVNVPCGWLKISYHAIITDKDSMPMIPDIPSYFEAIFWYVAMKMSYPKYLKGQLNLNIYYDMRNSWNFYRRLAYAEAMMPTVDELKSIQNTWDRLYPENDEHCTFFEHLGDELIIYNCNN
ncbi:tail tubular protein [uncultured phage cr109_1]|uniref:Tail tubular protein n=1 Tax=uncultured phage cr109_1 TaxID=2772083 RepID=A0A7M1RRY7_9CAUD|nr:tail tubular protein [uncultured phage cr109_1]QOR57046.1 tail tubular protein [uncultured phage cr109_1]